MRIAAPTHIALEKCSSSAAPIKTTDAASDVSIFRKIAVDTSSPWRRSSRASARRLTVSTPKTAITRMISDVARIRAKAPNSTWGKDRFASKKTINVANFPAMPAIVRAPELRPTFLRNVPNEKGRADAPDVESAFTFSRRRVYLGLLNPCFK